MGGRSRAESEPKEADIRRRSRYIPRQDTGPKVPINEAIRAPMLRVVVEGGDPLGVLTRESALREARERGLDLVEIAAQADPPVAKIMDYGKYAFQQKKKAQESKKKQKLIHVKEVKFRPRIDEHDYEFKRNHCQRFLEAGDKVKATIQFRGREMTRLELGRKVIARLKIDLEGIGVLESDPSMMGNRMHAIFAPDKKAVKAKPKPKPEAEAEAELEPELEATTSEESPDEVAEVDVESGSEA